MGKSKRQLYRVATAAFFCALLCAAVATGEERAPVRTAPSAAFGSVQVVRPGRVRLGGISIGGFYSHRSYGGYGYPGGYGYYGGYGYLGPYYYPMQYWSNYGPYGLPVYDAYGPDYYPSVYSGFASPPQGGEVKLQTNPSAAEVYINGSYAGTAEDLKSFRLEPGAYDLEIKAQDYEPFELRIYVLTGKTLKINTTLNPEKKETKQ